MNYDRPLVIISKNQLQAERTIRKYTTLYSTGIITKAEATDCIIRANTNIKLV